MNKLLTREQQNLMKWAIGDGKTWPRMTHDPQVNHAIDKRYQNDLPEWDNLSPSLKRAYMQEVTLQ